VDHVILATGQGTDLELLEGSGVEAVRGFISADPKTLMTNVPGVFAGGDGQRGPRTAVEAIRAGKIAAAGIDAWLRGTAMDTTVGKPVRRAEVIPIVVDAKQRTHQRRAAMPRRTSRRCCLGNHAHRRRPERHRRAGRGGALPARDL
jgi:hypothetical protein